MKEACDSKCVVCGELYDSSESGRESFINNIRENDSVSLKTQLSVILLLRKILGLSQSYLESLLRQNGNPSGWGITLCPPCNRVFLEAEFVHDRLSKLHQEFNELSKVLRKQLRKSNNCASNDLSNGDDDRSRRNTRRKKGSKTRSLEPDVLAEAAGEKTDFGILEGVRNELLKVRELNVVERNVECSVIRVRIQQLPAPADSVISNNDSLLEDGEYEESLDWRKSSSNERYQDGKSVSKRNGRKSLITAGTICTSLGFKKPKVEQDINKGFSIDDDIEEVSEVEFEDRHVSSPEWLPEEEQDNNAREDNEGTRNEENGKDVQASSDRVPRGACTSSQSSPLLNSGDFPKPSKTEKGFQCPLCSKLTPTNQSCKAHIRKFHYGERLPFHCHLCPKKMIVESRLENHLMRTHKVDKALLDEDDCKGAVEQPKVKLVYLCKLCPRRKRFKTVQALKGHKKMIHFGIDKPFECEFCDRTFRRLDGLEDHIRCHERQKKQKDLERNEVQDDTIIPRKKVKLLKYSKKQEEDTQGHIRIQEDENEITSGENFEMDDKDEIPNPAPERRGKPKPVKKAKVVRLKKEKKSTYCEKCDKTFKSRPNLTAHIRSVHSNVRLMCELCPSTFNSADCLQNHRIFQHHAELDLNPFKCSYCNQILGSKRNLDCHVRRKHTFDTKHKCPYCDRGFMFSGSLNNHIAAVHEKAKRHPCPYCPSIFPVRSYLEMHLRIHTGEKPYKCKVCSKDFSDKPTYNRHVEAHLGRIHKCTVDSCRKQFKTRHAFRVHMKTHEKSANRHAKKRNEDAFSTTTGSSESCESQGREEKPISHDEYLSHIDKADTSTAGNLVANVLSPILSSIKHDYS